MPTTATPKPNRRRQKFDEPPFAYRQADLPPLSGISASQWRLMIARGEVKAIRRGRMVLVPRSELIRITGAA